jgi:NADH-quinone oxidoreductase subunit M
MVMLGVFQDNTFVGLLVATGMVLGAGYMLWLFRKVVFGALVKDDLKAMLDLSKREVAIFLPLIVLTLWMGIYPSTFLDLMHVSVSNLLDNYQAALDVASQASTVAAQ